ncbi:MAG: hypothetical protein GY874_06135 [Desulfobacteraceae bacterium]|nr:hypothetical protein [Desulfobacteraceae bacterium]
MIPVNPDNTNAATVKNQNNKTPDAKETPNNSKLFETILNRAQSPRHGHGKNLHQVQRQPSPSRILTGMLRAETKKTKDEINAGDDTQGDQSIEEDNNESSNNIFEPGAFNSDQFWPKKFFSQEQQGEEPCTLLGHGPLVKDHSFVEKPEEQEHEITDLLYDAADLPNQDSSNPDMFNFMDSFEEAVHNGAVTGPNEFQVAHIAESIVVAGSLNPLDKELSIRINREVLPDTQVNLIEKDKELFITFSATSPRSHEQLLKNLSNLESLIKERLGIGYEDARFKDLQISIRGPAGEINDSAQANEFSKEPQIADSFEGGADQFNQDRSNPDMFNFMNFFERTVHNSAVAGPNAFQVAHIAESIVLAGTSSLLDKELRIRIKREVLPDTELRLLEKDKKLCISFYTMSSQSHKKLLEGENELKKLLQEQLGIGRDDAGFSDIQISIQMSPGEISGITGVNEFS